MTSRTGAAQLESSSSPLGVELEAMQATTRWLVGAAAVVLAVLLTGIQFSALGPLALDRPAQLAVAIIASTAGLASVGTILILAARVFVSQGWTLRKLAHAEAKGSWPNHWLRPELQAQGGLLTPDDEPHPARLYRRHRRLLVAWFQLQERGFTALPDDLDDPNSTERDYSVTNDEDVQRLRRRLDAITLIGERVTGAANLSETRRRYRQLIRALPIAGVILLIVVPAFAWATTVETETAVTAPTVVHIKFVQDPSVIHNAGLSPGCAGREIDAIAIGGTLAQPIVESVSDPRCVLHRLRVTPQLGTAIPDPPPE